MKTAFFAFLLLLFPALSQAQGLAVSQNRVVQGDTLIFTIVAQWRGPGIAVRVFDKTFQEDKFGKVYVGVDPDTPPGKYIAFLIDSRTGIRSDFYSYQEIEVVKRDFPKKKYSFMAPRATSSVRRAKEAAIINAAYAQGNLYENYTTGDYSYPLSALTITGEFYSKRIYTDAVRVHRGIDLRAAKGVPVMAINAGKVVLAVRKFSLEGNAVIVDHGSGIFSVYLHLSKLEVKYGQMVERGQVLGLAGATGDAKGPHLHFMVKVNGVAVDPLAFIYTMNLFLAGR